MNTLFAMLVASALGQEPVAGAESVAGRDAGSGTDRIRVTVAIDDREARRLVAPRLVVGPDAADFVDDGSLSGDVPGDGVWFAVIPAERSESLGFAVHDGGKEQGSFDVVLPAQGAAHFSLRSTARARPLVMDLRAAPPPDLAQAGDPVVASPGQGAETGDDAILVRFVVDDRALERLGAPSIAIEGMEPVALTDDGSLEADTKGDGIWVGEAVVQRSQYLRFEVREASKPVGALTVFLPSSAQAVLRVKTSEKDAGIEVMSEALATGAVEGPDPSTGTRLAHVLWVAIALFAVAFGYLRAAVWRAWSGQVRPVIGRMDRFLDREGVPRSDEPDS